MVCRSTRRNARAQSLWPSNDEAERLLMAHLESVLTQELEGATIEGESKLGKVLSRYSSNAETGAAQAGNRKRRGAARTNP
jgi:hypothetical protein